MQHNIVTRLDIKVIIATHTRLIKMKILLRDTWRKKFKIRLFRKRNKLSNSSPNESFFAQFQSYSSPRRKKVEEVVYLQNNARPPKVADN